MENISTIITAPTAPQTSSCKFLTQIELAARWNVSTKTLEQARWRGTGCRFYKIGRLVRYAITDIEAYEQNCIATNTSGDHHGRA